MPIVKFGISLEEQKFRYVLSSWNNEKRGKK